MVLAMAAVFRGGPQRQSLEKMFGGFPRSTVLTLEVVELFVETFGLCSIQSEDKTRCSSGSGTEVISPLIDSWTSRIG
jgi:hypothetical protein